MILLEMVVLLKTRTKFIYKTLFLNVNNCYMSLIFFTSVCDLCFIYCSRLSILKIKSCILFHFISSLKITKKNKFSFKKVYTLEIFYLGR